eukprot:12164723-Prorocentrum_lima.AAC.1
MYLPSPSSPALPGAAGRGRSSCTADVLASPAPFSAPFCSGRGLGTGESCASKNSGAECMICRWTSRRAR